MCVGGCKNPLCMCEGVGGCFVILGLCAAIAKVATLVERVNREKMELEEKSTVSVHVCHVASFN